MVKKISFILTSLIILSSFGISPLHAQEDIKLFRTKKDVRAIQKKLICTKQEIEKTTEEYKERLAKVKNECIVELAGIKDSFHKEREACIGKRKALEKQLTDDYNSRLQYLLQEETQLESIVEPIEISNFVKCKEK